MEFKNFLSNAASYIQDETSRAQHNTEEQMKKILRQKSDAEIKKMYRIRYDNPKWSNSHILLIEAEANRRGIN